MHIAVVVGLALSLGACASIVRGTDEQVSFQSEPPGAEVRLSTGLGCPETPCQFVVPRKDSFTATFSRPGYHPEQIHVGTRVSGGGGAALAGNVLAGGIIGVVVDASNGSITIRTPSSLG